MASNTVIEIAGSAAAIFANSLTIDGELHPSQTSGQATVRTTQPSAGQSIKIGLGDTSDANLIFAGELQSVDRTYLGKPANLAWPVSLVDYSFALNRRRPIGAFVGVSATTIAQALVSDFSSGFTSVNVQASLPAVTIQFDGSEDFMTCLSNLADLIGGYSYVDYTKDVHLFLTESSAAPDDLDGTGTKLQMNPPIVCTSDLSQARTRILLKGGGSTATAAVGTGATSSVAIGRPGPALAPTITESAVSDSFSAGNFQVKVSFVYSDGTESLPSPASNTLAASGSKKIHTTLELGDGRVTGRREYYQFNGGGFISGNNFTDVNDNSSTAADLTLNNQGRTPKSTAVAYSAGTTFVYVSDTSQFSATGGVAYTGSQTFTYTGRSTSSGPGALTGIPSSGSGSIGSSIALGDAIGAASINVADMTPFDSDGGTVIVGTQLITYGGTTAGCHVAGRPGPASAPTLSEGASTGSFSSGNYAVEYSYLYSDGGESVPSPACSPVAMSGNKFFHLGVVVGDARVTGRREYYSRNGGGFINGQNLDDIADNTTTAIDLAIHNYSRSPVSSPAGYAAGSVYLYVEDASQFAAGGGTARVGLQTFTYTGRSASSGVAALTGIPSSGAGSLTAVVNVDDVIFPSVGGSGALTGIPISGAGAIVNAINADDAVNIWVVRNDATAQSALAAIEGGDGIHEFLISDDTLTSVALCEARGDAELALFKAAVLTLTYDTRDTKTRCGKTVHVNLPSPFNVTGDFVIQSVQITFEGEALTPRYHVTASSVRFSLNDLLRRLATAA